MSASRRSSPWMGGAVLCGVVLSLALAPLHLAAPAEAAEPQPPSAPRVEPAQTLSTQDLKALVGTLENDAERQKLVAQLKALIAAREQIAQAQSAAPESPGAQLIAALSEEVSAASAALASAAGIVSDLPSLYDWAKRQATQESSRAAWLELFVKLAIVLALAHLAERLMRPLLRRPRRSVADREADPLWLRGAFLVARVVIDLVPILVFAALAYGVLPFTKPSPLTRVVTLAIVNANLIVRAALAVARAVLAPEAATLRLLGMSEETASYWFVWLRRLVGFSVYAYFAAEAALVAGLPRGGYAAMVKILGLAVAGLLTVLVLQNRVSVAHWIRGAPREGAGGGLHLLRARLADIWHVLALVYVAAIYAVWALRLRGGFEFILRASVVSVAVLVVAKLLASGGEGLLQRFFAIGPDLRRRFPALEARAGRYLPVLTTALRTVVYAVAVLILLQAWGAGSFGWLSSEVGRRVVGGLATIALTVVVALLVWEAVSMLIEYYLAKQATDRRAQHRRARARTLLPLVRRTFAIVLGAIVAFTLLAEFGVNIAPLLAGAGVVGIAVGFGAQTLVKDMITGFNIILEDIVAVGDVVTIGGESGVVESLSIRSIQLRDTNGAVHTIPFSEVTKVVNMTKDYAYAVFNIAIGYREDVDRVVEVVSALGAELQADAEFSPDILEPLETAGIDRFGEFAVILNTRIKTLPGRQWAVAREFNRRLKRRFDELGIEIPFPTRTVYVGSDKEGAAQGPRPALDPPQMA